MLESSRFMANEELPVVDNHAVIEKSEKSLGESEKYLGGSDDSPFETSFEMDWDIFDNNVSDGLFSDFARTRVLLQVQKMFTNYSLSFVM